MNAAKKARVTLAIFSACLTIALGVFVWIMLGAEAGGMAPVLLVSLALIIGVTITAQVIYALKGQIFEFDGRLAKSEVLFAVICFQVVMQLSFGFSLYAVNQAELQNNCFDEAYAHFTRLQHSAEGNHISDYQKLDLKAGAPEHIGAIFIAEGDRDYGTNRYYRFPINGGRLLMEKSQAYFAKRLQDFALSLLMSLVVSVLLMAELVLLAVKLFHPRYGAGLGGRRLGVYRRAAIFGGGAFQLRRHTSLHKNFRPKRLETAVHDGRGHIRHGASRIGDVAECFCVHRVQGGGRIGLRAVLDDPPQRRKHGR